MVTTDRCSGDRQNGRKLPMRIALLTLEALAAAAPVRRFVAAQPQRIALVALSDPFRPQRGGTFGQATHLLGRSGARFLPYLAANFVLPRLAGLLRPALRRGAGAATEPERTPLAALCARLGVPASMVADMNAPAFHDRLRASGAEAIVTFHCDQILTAATIATLPRGGINVHAGLLPDHRGPVPTVHALLEDMPRFGVTVHRLVPRIDAGAVLAQRALDLPPSTTALHAARHLHEAAVPLLQEVLDRMAAGTLVEQPMVPGPYCGFPTHAQLRHLGRAGRRAAGWADLLEALRTPI
jgi:folate-dependent phosphoribosylglycinamide formyltransferase PurN